MSVCHQYKEEKLLRNYFEYIVNIKNILYKVTAAIINKVHLTQKLDSTWIQWFRSNDCEILIMLKLNHHQQITFSICSSGCYNSCTAAKENLKLMN